MNKSRIVSYFILCMLSFSGLLGQLQPKFMLTKGVTGAEQYQIILSMNPDLSDPIWTSDPIPSSGFPYVYESSNPTLESGLVYYAQIIGLSNGVQHGIPGEIMLFQTPSISLPIIIDGTPFSWRGTDPPAASYEISVSPLQDMTNVVWTKNISETNTSPPDDIFELGKTYYWIVQGLSESGDQHGKPSKTGFFITGVIEPPNLTSPVNEQITNLNPEFSWNGVEDVSRYQILVSESDDFSSSLWIESTENTTISYPETALKLNRGVQYYWKVIPLDSEGKMIGSVESEVTHFKTPNPLDGLSLNSPVNVEIPSLKPTFSWSGIEEISLYTILLSSDDELSEIFWENSTSETQIIYPEEGLKLKYGTTYSWQVVPVDADGNSMKEAKSGVAKFQTPAVEPLVLNEPLNTAVNNLTPLFSWEAVDGTASYNLEISQSEEMSDLIFNSATNSPEFNYTGEPPLDNSSTYYWRIQALDENGNLVGSMSNVAFFSTPSVDEIELTSPLNITVSSLTPTFSWRTLENAVSYRISIVLDGEVIWNSEVEIGETFYPGNPPLVYETTYFWNVQPIDVDGNDFSINPQATFFTPELIKISLKSPVSEEVTSLTPDLYWEGIDVAAGYFVEVSKGEETSSYWSGTFSMTNITFPEDPPLEFGNTYFWTVRPLNADGELIGEKSDIAEFLVKEAQLMQVTLSEPMGEISTQSPTFSWQEEKAAAGYVIQVNSNEDFSNAWSATVGNTTVQYSGSEQLEFSQEYYWRIMPLNQDEEEIGNWSEAGSFIITTANIVNLVSPVNQEVFSLTPAFSWEKIESANKYEINVSDGEDFSNVLWSVAEIQKTQIHYPSVGAEQLQFGSNYFWNVKALNSEGNPLGDASSPVSFSISMDLVPELLIPVAIQVETMNPVFGWTEISGASKYSIIISSTEDFSEVMYQNLSVDNTGITYPDAGSVTLDYEGTYYWKVQAMDEAGSPLGDPSQTTYFITPVGEIEIILDFGD